MNASWQTHLAAQGASFPDEFSVRFGEDERQGASLAARGTVVAKYVNK